MIDFIFSIFLAFFLVRGVIKGLLSQIFSIAGVIFGVFLSYKYGILISYLFPFSKNVSKIVSYIGVFLVVYLTFFLTGFILKKFIKAIKLGWADRILGGVFGFMKAGFLIFILVFILKEFRIDLTKKSMIAREIYKVSELIKKHKKVENLRNTKENLSLNIESVSLSKNV